MSVKVAVRVRPFNAKEQNDDLIVEMTTNQTILECANKTRTFAFDYSFWSHDGFYNDENGYSHPEEDSNYADQQVVYDALGKEVLDNAWAGYHCCLFAYGQTGAGKSYSMIGYGANKGIVPIAAEEIFKRINLPQQEGSNKVEFEVKISMIEIYSEKIQDLLIPIDQRPSGGLKVRESKRLGVYVEGLKQVPVTNYAEIEEIMDIGNTHRTIGATEMNATSSRAHTIIVIDFKQVEILEKKKVEKQSIINLVDLAGSEKVKKTKASGDRLKEGCSINKSLTNLGLVISILAEKSGGKAEGKVVPYRNSALTRILQNALGGNSKTIMICAISPSKRNEEESLSTLRYADQAKKIKNKAVVNESETDKLIRNLKEENEALKKQLSLLRQSGVELPQELLDLEKGLQEGENEDDNEPKEDAQMSELETTAGSSEINDKMQQLRENERLISKMDNNEDDRDLLQMSQLKETEEPKKDLTIPHISNINEDAMLTGKIFHKIEEKNDLRVGRKQGDPVPEIVLAAIGIQDNHAVFTMENGEVTLKALDDNALDFIRVNGELLSSEGRKIVHLDRIVFGTASTFIFKDKTNADKQADNGPKEHEIDFEYCQKEITKADQMLENSKNLKLKESERFLENEKNDLKNQISSYLPQITEVNLIAIELKRMIKLSLIVDYTFVGVEGQRNGEKRLNLKVKVENLEKGYDYIWDLECFTNRYYMTKEIILQFYYTKMRPIIEDEKDPFWDPQEPQLIGKAYFNLAMVACHFESKEKLQITGEDNLIGTLEVEAVPSDKDGNPLDLNNLEPSQNIENPEELLGKRFDFILRIKGANISKGSDGKLLDMMVDYSLGHGDKAAYFKTEKLNEAEGLDFAYEKHHFIEKVKEADVNFLSSGWIEFQLKASIAPREPIFIDSSISEDGEDDETDDIKMVEMKKGPYEGPGQHNTRSKGHGRTRKSETKRAKENCRLI